MSRGALARRLKALEGRDHQRKISNGEQVLAELSLGALKAIEAASLEVGDSWEGTPMSPELEAKLRAILLSDAATPEVFARWDGLLRSDP